ncbi:MAG: hypothetical protein L6Q95_02775 [Planctomycetes bacterium]|nr:hypothetical protein [Planctomycetota bacterium]
MTRKTGALVLVALALSVAFLGVVLALRCSRSAPEYAPSAPVVETLTVGSGPQN